MSDVIYVTTFEQAVDAGEGDDTVILQAISSGFPNVTIDGGIGQDTFDARQVFVGWGTMFFRDTSVNGQPGFSVGDFDVTGFEVIYGNSTHNNSFLFQGLDAVTVHGGSGADWFAASFGPIGTWTADVFHGYGGDDYFNVRPLDHAFGGAGNDTFELNSNSGDLRGGLADGGDGVDTLDLSFGWSIDLERGVADSPFSGSLDVYSVSNIENVVVYAWRGYYSSVIGDENANNFSVDQAYDDGSVGVSFMGRGGDDTLAGSRVGDVLDGGDGIDTVSYRHSLFSVEIDFTAGTATGGDATGDILNDFENIEGSMQNDLLTGDAEGNALFGLDGNDRMSAGDGNDSMQGGAGFDTLYGDAGDDIMLGGGDDDSLYGGSDYDSLYGDAGNDVLLGGAGEDMLFGGAGARDRAAYSDALAGVTLDMLFGGTNTGDAVGDVLTEIEDLQGSAFGDRLLGDSGANHIWGGDGDDVIFGRVGPDRLFGGIGNDILLGGAGADMIDGGTGIRDRAQYSDATAGLRADLMTPASNSAFAAGDFFVGIEDLHGSTHADTLFGDSAANIIWGVAGTDMLYGRAGADTLQGGLGNDTLTGGAGLDHFVFNSALGATNVDQLADFSSADDTVRLENSIFTALLSTGALSADAFTNAAAASTAAHRIVYHQASGQLFYDADGIGGNAQILFATLTEGTAMNASDFLVI